MKQLIILLVCIATPLHFVEESTWLKENARWLLWSRKLAITLIGYMPQHTN